MPLRKCEYLRQSQVGETGLWMSKQGGLGGHPAFLRGPIVDCRREWVRYRKPINILHGITQIARVIYDGVVANIAWPRGFKNFKFRRCHRNGFGGSDRAESHLYYACE